MGRGGEVKVSELIKILESLPPAEEISIFYDGAARGGVEGIVNSGKDGIVIIAEWSIYRDESYRAYPEDEIVYEEMRD